MKRFAIFQILAMSFLYTQVGFTQEIIDKAVINGGTLGAPTVMFDASAADDQTLGMTFFGGSSSLDFDSRAGSSCMARFSYDAPFSSLSVARAGVGLGIPSPTSRFHVFSDGGDFSSSTMTAEVSDFAPTQDRTMLNLVNNGGAFMTFTDTSQTGGSTWFFSNANDELFIKKSGVGSPGMRILANGEFRFVSNNNSNFQILSNGNIRSAGVLQEGSDRTTKENIHAIDPTEVLSKVVDLPISTWNYIRDENDTTHMGPMSQDFFAAFSLGSDDKSIAGMDKDGVALAAIQGLNQKVEAKEETIVALNESVEKQSDLIAEQSEQILKQNEMIDELSQRLEQLESLVSAQQK